MNALSLQQFADRLIAGELSAAEFAVAVQRTGIADVGVAQVDMDRHRRCGFPEVIYAEGKTIEAIARIIGAQIEQKADVLATRMTAEQAAELLARFPTAAYNPAGRTFRISQSPKGGEPAGRVTIVTAGTSDLPVGEEAR
jgi:pyridinium-3,5-biscarboxylic acid mononucleotide synthase